MGKVTRTITRSIKALRLWRMHMRGINEPNYHIPGSISGGYSTRRSGYEDNINSQTDNFKWLSDGINGSARHVNEKILFITGPREAD